MFLATEILAIRKTNEKNNEINHDFLKKAENSQKIFINNKLENAFSFWLFEKMKAET